MAPQPPDSAAAWARELATADGNRPQQLLQHLYALQQRYAHVPAAAQDQLASSLGLTRAEVRAVVGFINTTGCSGKAAPVSSAWAR